ncbi:MAG TPA: hypothetical protein VF116_10440 [Ktedonobacterales bacterium]
MAKTTASASEQESGALRVAGMDDPSFAISGAPTDGPVARLIGWTQRYPLVPLLLACALSLAARVFLLVRTHAMIDGDEALVGIQAQGILHGRYPTYFYAQPYMGSLEAYLAAALFRVFGASSWTLRAVPILLSLLLVYLTWRLARALLPADAPTTPLVAGLAALAAAVPPLYDAVAEMRTWGGQIEVYVVTLALLLCGVELARRLRSGAGAFELARRWAILGFLAGLGIWINPLVSYALVACALWLLPPLLARAFPTLAAALASRSRWAGVLLQPATDPSPAGVRSAIPSSDSPSASSASSAVALSPSFSKPSVSSVPSVVNPSPSPRPPRASANSASSVLSPLLALIPGLAIGGLPAWLYALHNGGENLLVYVTQPAVSPAVSGAARHGRLFLGAAITARYFSCVAPRVLDGGLPAEPLAALPLRYLLLLPPLAGIACALWLVRTHLVGRDTPFARTMSAGLPLLFAGIVTAVFCLGTSAWGATKACSADWAGRYAVPLGLVEPLLLIALFAAPGAWSALRVWRGRTPLASVALRRGWALALAVLFAAGVLQAGSYALTSPTATFQSPFYSQVPLDVQPLLDYLAAHDIHDAWCNHWLGNVVTFETAGRTTCADYYDQVVSGGLHRPPGTLEAVSAADRASFILIGQDAHPLLAHELDAQGISYTLAYIPASNVTVITPDHTVDPSTVVPGLAVDYD